MFANSCRALALGVVSTAAFFLFPGSSQAGCGCDKPPPPPAAIRPAFASPGATVTLFGDKLRAEKTYKVRFKSPSAEVTVQAVGVLKRDLADGVVKPQVPVVVPALPPGPTSVRVTPDADTLLDVPASAFTVLQAPMALEQSNGETLATCYRAAVGADGRVYIPLDIGAIAERMVFSGLGKSYPLLFGASDIAIYNTQGFLMQLLGPQQAEIFAISDPGTPNSFELTYDRHEFVTYRAAHVHEGSLALDPADPAWHVDGTRHVDHDHLVVAIQGSEEGRGTPQPGVTPPFDLSIVTALAGSAIGAVPTRVIQWSTECSSQ